MVQGQVFLKEGQLKGTVVYFLKGKGTVVRYGHIYLSQLTAL